PSALVSKEITENSALLSWKAPEKVESIQEYVVYQDGKEIGRVPADKTPLEFLAKDLKPNTKYNFQVSSIDKNGKESDKISLEVTTNEKDNGNLPNTGSPIGAVALATTGIALSSAGVYLTLKKKRK
ncbi:MAG: fibronectin type III domain-containing protein, partial [Clostridium perfringens]|nr:fibronectin type III domain-containing protein [Clostridium perfringens]